MEQLKSISALRAGTYILLNETTYRVQHVYAMQGLAELFELSTSFPLIIHQREFKNKIYQLSKEHNPEYFL